jgi:hypothetical protein
LDGRESLCPRGSQRSRISSRKVDLYATYRRRKASIYGRAAAGGGGCQRQSSTTNGTNPTKGMGTLGFALGRVSRLKCQSVEQKGPGARDCRAASLLAMTCCGLRIGRGRPGGHPRHNAQNKPNLARPEGESGKQTQFRPPAEGVGWGRPSPDQVGGQALRRAESCETKPILPGPRRLTEGIVQNEAKLRRIGPCRQRRSSRGPWGGRGVKRAKRTQFGRSARPQSAKCAKRTQFRDRGPLDCGLGPRIRVRRRMSRAAGKRKWWGEPHPTRVRMG